MPVVEVQIPGRPYPAIIESGLLNKLGAQLRERVPDHSRYVIVTNPNVEKLFATTITQSLTEAGLASTIVTMQDGEKHKTLSTVGDLATKLVRRGTDRKSAVLAVGGGVVGDVAAFLASIYMRGIDVVQVPTTLLAQVDASIGGKTGVDLSEGKNLLGTFHQPRAVFVDPAALSSLPDREFRAGLYEALKCGIIRRPDIFQFIEQNHERILQKDPATLEWLITEAIRVKADVVAADEREGDLRRILNFGHTVGHALEVETGYKQFLHGEAVAWGMVAASMIAAAMQRTDSDTARKIISAVLALAPLPKVEVRGKKIARRLSADKKTLDGVVHFVLPVQIGRVEIASDVPQPAVIQAVEELRYLSGK
ncbi:MAG: 3-dehydroquinate synthase [Terriglobales bacterium]